MRGALGPRGPLRPLRVALVDDYEVVVAGLAQMLRPFEAQVEVVELDAGTTDLHRHVDVVLYDTFAQPRGESLRRPSVESLLDRARCEHLVVYTWRVDDDIVAAGRQAGAHGCVGKHVSAEQLVESLERVCAGEEVVVRGQAEEVAEGDWPGRSAGLSERESEVLALITQGLPNEKVAACAYLSINTVKTYVRSAYRKIGVTSRSQAVLWGVEHGLRPDHSHTTAVGEAGALPLRPDRRHAGSASTQRI